MTDQITTIEVLHGSTARQFSIEQLPLSIGTTSSADIRVPGPGGQSLLSFDLLAGKLLLQPQMRPSPVQLDGEALSAATALDFPVTFSVHGSELGFAQHDAILRVKIASHTSEFETPPPILEVAERGEKKITTREYQAREQVHANSGKKRVLAAAIIFGLASLAGVAIWFATAVSVRFQITPESPALISIDGPGIALPVGERYLLRKGLHRVSVQSPGFVSLTRDIEVGGPQNVFVLEQQALPGVLVVVAANASEATITLRTTLGARTEQSLPARFEDVLPGDYEIEVSAPGFLPLVDQLTVIGKGRVQTFDAALIEDIARVQFVSEPAGAQIYATGESAKLLGTTPGEVRLASGRHRLLFQLDGYKPIERNYRVFADTVVEAAPLEFEPADASLLVRSQPSGASVKVDGHYRGQTPLTLALNPQQRYEIALSLTGFDAVSRRVSLLAATRETIDIDMRARLGDLTIRTVPVDANIYVDGELAGTGTLRTALSARPHKIAVRRKGYVDWERSVTPRPGYPQTLDARLLSLREARMQSIEQLITVANDHQLRYVSGGTFSQGSSRREIGRRANENLRDVRISKAFYFGVHEVTNKQFAEFRRNHDSGASVHPSIGGDNNPVASVSWQDAAAYCNWLSEKEGLTNAYQGKFGELVPVWPIPSGYRLPTEAEWDWVARYAGSAGRAARFSWGDALPPPARAVNIADKTAENLLVNFIANYNDGFPSTAPVGSFTPNALGVHDLNGNVAEWIHDYYASTAADSALVDPTGPAEGASHVFRGAGWRDSSLSRLRLAYRDFGEQGRDDLGFRIVRYAQVEE